MKRLLLSLFFVASVSYGQDVYTGATTSAVAVPRYYLLSAPFRRHLLVYMYGNSGNITSEGINNPLFSKNETELGLRYSQNFVRAPWLTVYVHMDLSSTLFWQYDNLGGLIPNSASLSIESLQPLFYLGAKFTPYLSVHMQSDGVLVLNTSYTHRWRGHFLTILGSIDFNFFNVPLSEYRVGLSYEYRIADWTIGLLAGVGLGNDFASTLYLRVDGILSYTIDGVKIWARVRYEPRHLIPTLVPPEFATGNPALDIITSQHNIMLIAGFNYLFDFIPGNLNQ